MEKVETTLGEIQTTQYALVIVMEKIQNHLMKDGDPDETSSVEETPAVSESIPPQSGPPGETVEPAVLSGTSFQADPEKRQSGGKGGGKGNKGNWGPSGGPKGKVQIILGDSQQEVAAGTVMVVMGGASTSGVKHQNPTNRVRGPRASRGRSPLQPASCVEKSTL